MGQNVAQKLIGSPLADGEMTAGSEIGLRIDQTLTQDATGTMVMLELEALGLDRVRTQASVQYVDHNLLQADERNMADHLFLRSACQRFGLWYSRPGNGVSHPVHMQQFGRPGASAGRLGLAHLRGRVAGHARHRRGRPGGRDGHGRRAAVRHDAGDLGGSADRDAAAVGERQDVNPGDLRRHGVKGGAGRIIEYHGARPGLAVGDGPARDRQHGRRTRRDHQRLPADEQVRAFLSGRGAAAISRRCPPIPMPVMNVMDEIDLDGLEPLIARRARRETWCRSARWRASPSTRWSWVSSANPGLRDFAVLAAITGGRQAHPQVSDGRQPHLAADPGRT